MPPKGVAVVSKRSPWSPENETAALAGLKNMLGGVKPKAES